MDTNMKAHRFALTHWLLHFCIFLSQASLAASLGFNSENDVFIGTNTVTDEGALSAGIPSSSDCWLHAIRTMEIDATSTADACSRLTTRHQKILALEMALCHVKDLGHELFDETNSPLTGDMCSPATFKDNPATCLTVLTPSAETSYTHIIRGREPTIVSRSVSLKKAR
mmetsp:Transcript_63311/g.177160  ORF Transcript_63311/g.177160 Transcript_63311/m.177160 type:complete len:169 (+) Transcript_63311:5431-5937(+)